MTPSTTSCKHNNLPDIPIPRRRVLPPNPPPPEPPGLTDLEPDFCPRCKARERSLQQQYEDELAEFFGREPRPILHVMPPLGSEDEDVVTSHDDDEPNDPPQMESVYYNAIVLA